MSSLDSELFELCREVGELFPTWDIEATYYRVDGDSEIKYSPTWFNILSYKKSNPSFIKVPAFTSDYLLEKLPKKIKHHGKRLSPSLKFVDEHKWWLAQYYEIADGVPEYNSVGNTSTIALLKLTLALKEAGEL